MARLIIIVFLIALLPLHGLSAASMSVSMAASERLAVALISSEDQEAMPRDCPMLGGAIPSNQRADSSEGSLPGPKSHLGCQTCQACVPFAMHEEPLLVWRTPATPWTSRARTDSYVSASLAEDSKPPIF